MKFLISVLLICFLGIIAYSNSFFCSFHFDDELHLLLNPAVQNISDLPGIWNYYHTRFITFLSLGLNYHLNGFNVLGFHIFNLAVHLITAILVWWLTLLTFSTPAMKDNKIASKADILALFAGLVFVTHPLQTEAVTYIWERAASMTAMFYLASLCFYIKSKDSAVYYICSLVTAVAAMFTKENAVTLPLVLLAYEYTFLKTSTGFAWRRLFPFLLTLLIIPLTLLLGKSQTFQEHHGILSTPSGTITPMHYLLTQFRVMVTYIRLAFVPLHQNLDYDYPIFKSILELPVLIGLLSLVVIFYWTIRLFLNYRLVSFSIFWFFLTLIIPESSFWAMGDVISEHRLYLPMVGYSLFLVSGIYYLWGRNSTKTMVILLTLIVACNSFLTFQRNRVWKNELTLWGDVIRKSPHKARGYINRGIFWAGQNNYNAAVADFTMAIEAAPGLADAFYDRGNAYLSQGHFPQALSDYDRAVELSPGYAIAYNNRAVAYYSSGNYAKAWADVQRAEKLGTVISPVFLGALKGASKKSL